MVSRKNLKEESCGQFQATVLVSTGMKEGGDAKSYKQLKIHAI